MSINKKDNKNSETKKRRQYVKNLVKSIKQLRSERKTAEPRTGRRKPSGKVASLFLYFGVIALASSLISNSSILAFIGLSFLLWGGLFLYARPAKYVREDILDSTAKPYLTNLEKILTELHFEGKGIHLPPGHLKEPKESVVFVPLKMEIRIPPAEDVAKGRVFLNPEGAFLIAPGQGLLNLYEKKLGLDFSRTNLNELKNNLHKLLIEDLEILDSLEIDYEENRVHVKMMLSAFKGLCNQLNFNICSRLGCPLCSSIAGALAKVTGKAVIIEEDNLSPDGKTVEVWYRFIQG
jgi:hypothetical protein